MSGCFDLDRIEFDQRLSCLYMVSFVYKELESVSAHIYGINAHVDQEFQSVGKCQAACMAGVSHNNAHVTVCRSGNDCIGRLDCESVAHDFL